MACTILRSEHHNKALHALVLFSLVLLMQRVVATEFKVGGSNGWTVPTDPNAPTYNQWAEKNRFQIGDSLLFVYQPNKDSVLQVNKEDYTNCNIAAHIKVFKDGNTSFKFNQSGHHYFISGNKDNCLKNEKMVLVVMADRKKQSSGSNQTSMASPPPSYSNETIPSPAPAPIGIESPPPSYSNETTPSPAPAPIGIESPPPSGLIETIPSPAPAGEESPSPPPSPTGASSTLAISFVSSVGAFFGSSLILVLTL